MEEKRDQHLAEEWYSGGLGASTPPSQVPSPQATETSREAEWARLRDAIKTADEQAAKEAEHPRAAGRARRFALVALGVAIIATVVLIFARQQGGLSPAQVTQAAQVVADSLKDFFQSPPVAAEGGEEPESSNNRSSRRNRRSGGTSVASSASGAVGATAAPDSPEPFLIEVVDGNQKTVLSAPERIIQLNISPGDHPQVRLSTRPSTAPPVAPGEGPAEGAVVLAGVVGTDGRIRELRPLSGPADLYPAAIQAARTWYYAVPRKPGATADSRTIVTVYFNIVAQ